MARFDLTIWEEDKQWVRNNYPALNFSRGTDGFLELSGDLIFNMLLCEKGNPPYIINPGEQYLSSGLQIKDTYKIKIIFKEGENSDLPQVYETNSRIASVALKREDGKKENLHIYNDSRCCLCMRFDEEGKFTNGFDLREFFYHLVIPFFYAQSYFENKGEWPWDDYSHDVYGILEWYYDKGKLSDKERTEFKDYLNKSNKWKILKEIIFKQSKTKVNSYCIFGCSRKKYKNCRHLKILMAIWKLRNNRGDMP